MNLVNRGDPLRSKCLIIKGGRLGILWLVISSKVKRQIKTRILCAFLCSLTLSKKLD